MRIEVNGPPPVKDGGMSSRGESHLHFPHVQQLREAMRRQVTDDEHITRIPVILRVHFDRATSRADALNLVNGIADVIQARGNPGEPWMIDDDANITEFHYTETRTESDRYTVEVTPR